MRARTVPLGAGVLAAGLLAVGGLAAGCASLDAARHFRSGTQALDRGEPVRAVAELERAVALAPEASAVHNHLGLAYEEAGRPDLALRAFERAVALDCENEAAAHNLRALRARRPATRGRLPREHARPDQAGAL